MFSTDGRCGPLGKYQSCSSGCCSRWGWCGSGSQWCDCGSDSLSEESFGVNCDERFGRCGDSWALFGVGEAGSSNCWPVVHAEAEWDAAREAIANLEEGLERQGVRSGPSSEGLEMQGDRAAVWRSREVEDVPVGGIRGKGRTEGQEGIPDKGRTEGEEGKSNKEGKKSKRSFFAGDVGTEITVAGAGGKNEDVGTEITVAGAVRQDRQQDRQQDRLRTGDSPETRLEQRRLVEDAQRLAEAVNEKAEEITAAEERDVAETVKNWVGGFWEGWRLAAAGRDDPTGTGTMPLCGEYVII